MINKKNIILIFCTCLLSTFFSLFHSTKVLADEGNPLGFSAETIMPANQIDQNKTYFYVQTNPDEQLTMKVKLVGNSEEPVKVKGSIANAITGAGGSVDYVTGSESDETLKNSIEEFATLSETEFELKNKEEKIIDINVKMPKENYDGVKMGAVYFTRVMDEKGEAAISSDYSYRIGVILSETDGTYTDSKSLNLLEAKPELNRKQKSVGLVLQNPEPKTIADFYVDATIVEEKSGKVIKTQKLSSGMMAPNSRFTFPVEWGVTAIKPGKYIAKVKAKSRYDSWELEKKFEITDEQAKELNAETVFKLSLPTWAYIATIILGIMMVILSVFLAIRAKKWKEEIRKIQKKRKKIRKKKNEKEKGS